jgi:hypothetical protein
VLFSLGTYRPLSFHPPIGTLPQFARQQPDLFSQKAMAPLHFLPSVQNFRLPLIARMSPKDHVNDDEEITDVEIDTGWKLPTPDGTGVIIFPELPPMPEIPIIPEKGKPEIQDDGRLPLHIDRDEYIDNDEVPTEQHDDEPERGSTIVDYKL